MGPLYNDLPAFFERRALSLEEADLPGREFVPLFERLTALIPDADTYFSCLATLYKSRLKYERILEEQPIPTLDQVGPRGLLQYGNLSTRALAGLLFWRKWMFDIDNRAGQETGYLFEPIIAYSIGGTPAGAQNSPIFRGGDKSKGRRQVDCIRGNNAYEIKIRVTIAASGQGRWKEELSFPQDCRASQYTPVLIVLDPTRNTRLDRLEAAFEAQGGKAYIENAWDHLDGLAGDTMAHFLERYVKEPIQAILAEAPAGPELPELVLRMGKNRFVVSVTGESYTSKRTPKSSEASDKDSIPDDADEIIPGS